MGIELKEVVIYKFEEGAFFSELLIEQNGKEHRIDSRTSDAVAIAIRTHSPIYTTEEIMRNMAVVFDEKSVKGGGETLQETNDKSEEEMTDLRLDTLKERLRDAVREENYELATRLRDEINRRESKS